MTEKQKQTRRASTRKWRFLNPLKYKAQQERYKISQKKKYHDNPSLILTRNKSWRDKNPLTLKLSRTKWRRENPDKVREYRRRERAKRKLKKELKKQPVQLGNE